MSWFDRELTAAFRESVDRERAFMAQRERCREREKEDAKEDRREATADDLVAAVEQAAELREITERLDVLDLQVTQALVENDRRLDDARTRVDQILSEAVVLPDGRRVFRTEDGTQVFDEFGEEIPAEELDPDSIPDDAPTWEAYQEALDEVRELEAERERLLELQSDIDAAREAAEAGELEPGALDALEAEFGAVENDAEPGAEASPDAAQPVSPSSAAAVPADSSAKIQP